MACEGRPRAVPMSFREMILMVEILDRKDYDCKLARYPKANVRKDHILQTVVAVLQRKCGATRTKCQVRKRWSDLKHKESLQLESIRRTIARKRIRRNFRKLQIKQEPKENAEPITGLQCEEEEHSPKVSQKVGQSLSAKNMALQKIATCLDEIGRLKASIRILERDISEVQQLMSDCH